MNPQFIYFLGDMSFLSGIPALVLFIGFYFVRSRWRERLVGRTLMYFALALLLIIAIVGLSIFLGTEYFLREWVRLAGYVLLSFTMWRMFLVLIKIQKYNPDQVKELAVLDEPRRKSFWNRKGTKASVRKD